MSPKRGLSLKPYQVLFFLVVGVAFGVLGKVLFGQLKGGSQDRSPANLSNFEHLLSSMPDGPLKDEVTYGRDLINNTAALIGPNGKMANATDSRMSCTNCHIDGGSRPFGLQLTDTHGLYPQYRSREGKILTLAERINACLVMSNLGDPLPESSREMQAMLMYLRFLGAKRPILSKDKGDRLATITFPDFAASPERGKKVFRAQCARCHGMDGAGVLASDGNGYIYPPLWGPESYRQGSSMSRVAVLARFVKANMPFGEATPENPVLSDVEALDVAAFINSENLNPRPPKPKGSQFYPRLEFKPFDYPEGPYLDPFPQDQHKYGPFQPIIDFYKERHAITKPTDGDLNAP